MIKFQISKIQHGGRPPFLTNRKVANLCKGLPTHHKILHDDAHWFSEPFPQFKNRLLEIQHDGWPPFWKKPLNYHNLARFDWITTKFCTMTHFFKLSYAYTRLKIWFLKNQQQTADAQTCPRSIYSKQLSNVQNRYGAHAARQPPTGEYDSTVHVRRRCGLLSITCTTCYLTTSQH